MCASQPTERASAKIVSGASAGRSYARSDGSQSKIGVGVIANHDVRGVDEGTVAGRNLKACEKLGRARIAEWVERMAKAGDGTPFAKPVAESRLDTLRIGGKVVCQSLNRHGGSPM